MGGKTKGRGRPRNKKDSATQTARTAFRKYKYNKALTRIARSFPQKMIVTMKYSTYVRLDPSVGAPVAYNWFRANSIYDPDQTGTGHQPYSHDTYQTIYQHYRVLSSKIICNFVPNGSSSTGHVVCGVITTPTVEPALVLDYDTIRERDIGKYKINSGQDQVVKVTGAYNSKKMYPSNVGNLNALFGNNPTEEAYFAVYATATNETLDASSVDVIVDIYYKVLMWELKNLGES